MSIRSARRSVPAKWCSSAALATRDGKRANPAATSCAFARFAWIVTLTPCWCGWKPLGQASATKDIGAASFGRWDRTVEQRLLRNELFRRKQSTDRRKADELVEAGNPKRQPAGSNAGPLCARGLENYPECAQLRANH